VVRKLQEVEARPPAPAPTAEVKVFRPVPSPDEFTVEREADGFRVRGQTVERIVAMTGMDQEEALLRLHFQLERLGVLAALEAQGVQEGDMVYIGEAALEWTDETGL
jgi:GTP-binding protein